jgi:hypothetical protein
LESQVASLRSGLTLAEEARAKAEEVLARSVMELNQAMVHILRVIVRGC